MKVENLNTNSKNPDFSLPEFLEIFKKYWNYIISKWLLILIFGVTGGILGLITSLLLKPTYTAHLSFSLVEKTSGGGLADLASTFGLSGLMGGGNNSVFSGDNLLEIIQSRYAIEQTLLTAVDYKNVKETLVEVYIQSYDLRKKWEKIKLNPDLKNLKFPIGQNRDSFSRTQDSVLYSFYSDIISSKSLSVERKSKKLNIVNVDFISRDELFSKLFVEKLMDETYRFYSITRTAQSRSNINMMQHTADSIKSLYESALYKGAGFSQVNVNQALQFASVPRIKQENNAQLYGTVYAEVLKNLETLKLDLARETPIIQIIDTPRLPLKINKFGKAKGLIIGSFLGGFLIVGYLFLVLYFKELLEKK